MRCLLDTDIISYLHWPQPPAELVAWLAERTAADLCISAMTVAEIRNGILEMDEGRKRAELEAWFHGADGPLAYFKNRILPFDDHAAMIWARLMATGKTIGRRRSERDMVIAATAEANDCLLVTNNERDFAGLDFINPLRGGIREATAPYLVSPRAPPLPMAS